MSPVAHAALGVAIGAGATGAIDLWNLALRRLAGVPSLDYCLLGRWVAHMRRGTFRHRGIGLAARAPFECVLGWVAHYAIGIGLALLLLSLVPRGWISRPTLLPALAFGLVTVVFPFFVLQPALGLGIASSAARDPWRARLKSLATHTVYGLGLYACARVVAALLAP